MKEMLTLDWESLLSNSTIEEAYTAFNIKYEEAKKQCVPVGENHENQKFKKPIWMKHSTEKSVKNKHQAWLKYLQTKHPRKKEKYRKMRNKVSHQTKEDRKTFEKKLAEEVKTNNKAFWKYAGSQRKMKKEIPNLKKKDGTLTENDQEKADILNEQFTSIFTKEDIDNIPDFEDIPLANKLTSITITEEMVLKQLKSPRIDKSPGPDNIHPFILKNLLSRTK